VRPFLDRFPDRGTGVLLSVEDISATMTVDFGCSEHRCM